jgi:hypothetical protein
VSGDGTWGIVACRKIGKLDASGIKASPLPRYRAGADGQSGPGVFCPPLPRNQKTGREARNGHPSPVRVGDHSSEGEGMLRTPVLRRWMSVASWPSSFRRDVCAEYDQIPRCQVEEEEGPEELSGWAFCIRLKRLPTMTKSLSTTRLGWIPVLADIESLRIPMISQSSALVKLETPIPIT